MTLSLPEGVSYRPLTRDDAGLVAELVAEDERSMGLAARIGESDVQAWWIRTNLEEDSWLLEEGGRTIAVGWMEVHDGVAFGGSGVRPGAKGRGLGTWLLAAQEERAWELGAARLHQHTMAADPSVGALMASRGYREARRHYEMAIELDAEPSPPELPNGLAVDTFREEEAREFHDAMAEAFADEWGFVSMPFEQWWEMRGGDDHSLWFVVREGERIAAYARCEAGRHGGGFVGMLGVRGDWRKRGLGRALLLHAFRVFWERGITRVTLGVDSENPTGATRLYESVGMHVESESVTFEKELR
ncbi:MAG TPA: GNAT family N-acetyltransferase [Gaiellaceae bacterium]|nr:GNAT family N-acetyltransferase [Gaiellaceae bacterium]